jgi:hypothetical protein
MDNLLSTLQDTGSRVLYLLIGATHPLVWLRVADCPARCPPLRCMSSLAGLPVVVVVFFFFFFFFFFVAFFFPFFFFFFFFFPPFLGGVFFLFFFFPPFGEGASGMRCKFGNLQSDKRHISGSNTVFDRIMG